MFARYCALLLPLLLASAGTPAEASPGASRLNQGVVVLFGTSSVNDTFGRLIERDLQRAGYTVVRRGYPVAGLARPDFCDLSEQLARLPISPKTDAVLVYLGGNDAQALWLRPEERPTDGDPWVRWDDERWPAFYRARTRRLIGDACSRGAKRVVVLAPVDVAGSGTQHRLERIRRLQRQAAKATPCGRFLSTSGDVGQLGDARQPLRSPDGRHMTRVGSVRVWKRIQARVQRLISADGASQSPSRAHTPRGSEAP
ncbi:MAG: hypothetical protein ABI895_20160 [Deltaproteobacteria bacterium]